MPVLPASLSCCKDLRNHPIKPKRKLQELQFTTKFKVSFSNKLPFVSASPLVTLPLCVGPCPCV